MSTLDTTPGVEVTGGSLGHGLGVGLGIALGVRLAGRASRVFIELSDGELQEGATWEAAMAGSHFALDNVVALNDCNGIQADGRIVLHMEPIAEKWRAFGWDTIEIDGNNMEQIIGALAASRARNGRPKAIVLRTLPGKGVGTLERREKATSCASRRTSGRSSVANWRTAMTTRPGVSESMAASESVAGAGFVQAPLGLALRALGQARPDVVGLTADMAKYTDILPFAEAFPERFFNVGMAEQNMIAMAAGLAKTGLFRTARPTGCSRPAGHTTSSRSPAPTAD